MWWGLVKKELVFASKVRAKKKGKKRGKLRANKELLT
jgi:hypothetical protein